MPQPPKIKRGKWRLNRREAKVNRYACYEEASELMMCYSKHGNENFLKCGKEARALTRCANWIRGRKNPKPNAVTNYHLRELRNKGGVTWPQVRAAQEENRKLYLTPFEEAFLENQPERHQVRDDQGRSRRRYFRRPGGPEGLFGPFSSPFRPEAQRYTPELMETRSGFREQDDQDEFHKGEIPEFVARSPSSDFDKREVLKARARLFNVPIEEADTLPKRFSPRTPHDVEEFEARHSTKSNWLRNTLKGGLYGPRVGDHGMFSIYRQRYEPEAPDSADADEF